jgi:hypothetical protein
MARLGVGLSLPSVRQTTSSTTVLLNPSGIERCTLSIVCVGGTKGCVTSITTPANRIATYSYISGPAVVTPQANGNVSISPYAIGPVLIMRVISGIPNSYGDTVSVRDYGVNC